MIEASGLTRTFKVPVREAGLGAAAASIFRRRTREVLAASEVSFTITPGEIVGFLGPNGAGKTTTLKMLAGLLHPTSGHAQVLGHTPWRRQRAYLRQIALVMGNRNQLQWDLPAGDSFELNQAIYDLPVPAFRRTRDELVDLLEAGSLIDKPVRNLSLGERMRVEVIASLLHRPKVLFLDEPTLGLDITMQKRIRSFLADYNRQHGTTVLLTSHYMADVESLCRRVIVIHHGRIVFDGLLADLTTRFAADKYVTVTLAEPADLTMYGEVVADQGDRITVRVAKAATPSVTAHLLASHAVIDLSVADPPIEDVVEQLFATAAP